MSENKKVKIGIVGSGFAANIHMESYRSLPSEDFCISAVCSTNVGVKQFAENYGIPVTYSDFDDLISDDEISIVDIITPPSTHADMIIKAMQKGKNVICEKPLTGFFRPSILNGETVSRKLMREEAEYQLSRIKTTMEDTGKQLFYAENFVYAPAVQKCAEFLKARKSKVTLIKGEESHSGSHAKHAPFWEFDGGGALIRQGCHPLSAALYLKQIEAEARKERIIPKSVTCIASCLSDILKEEEHRYIFAKPVDVEDYAMVIITFSDGSSAQILASDNVLGGVRNNMEIYTNEGCYQCSIAPNNGMMVFHEDDNNLKDIYFTEKLGQKAGWQPIFLEENRMRGYEGELTDFINCTRSAKKAQSDFNLAETTIRLIYAAYQSAQEKRTIEL